MIAKSYCFNFRAKNVLDLLSREDFFVGSLFWNCRDRTSMGAVECRSGKAFEHGDLAGQDDGRDFVEFNSEMNT